MNWLGWVLAIEFFGTTVLLVSEDWHDWHLSELLLVIGWPVTLPVMVPYTRWQRHRRTCSVCHSRFQDRETMFRHKENSHVESGNT